MTAPKDPSGKVVAEILAGRHDGKLGDFVKAIRERANEGAVGFRWRLRFEDDEWTEETVTFGEIQVAEKLTGSTWTDLNPRTSADHCLAFIVAHLHKVGGLKIQDARDKAELISGAQLGDVVSEYEVVNPPKDPDPSPSS